jgi:tRNA dimethylallyltransferase
MDSLKKHPPIVVFLGPTAVGKTKWSLRIAEKLEGEIVSMDSRQIYRGMDIGTAKPTAEERSRIRHHLIDVADPDETWGLAEFRRAALDAIADIHSRHRLPFLVGGTGQYITALLEGWVPPSRPPDEMLRKELEAFARQHGVEALHARLAEVDPLSAERIAGTNVRRVIRALEIFMSAGIPASQLRRKESPHFCALKIGLYLPRRELYQRIDTRIEAMMEAGFVEEVRALLDQGYDPDLPSMSAIGYKQVASALLGKLSMEEAIQQMRRSTRQFVRRQANWFKRSDPDIHWFDVSEEIEGALLGLIRSWLRE